jgi:L-ornithine N5-oxygenase
MWLPEGGDATVKSPLKGSDTTYDVLGIGFGPSNLALAIAIEEHNADLPAEERLNALFLERQPSFGWHRGMLIDDATMQVSFLKDLVTLRNPTSEFSFLAYLHGKGRLVDFINHKSLFPLRVEFHDYLEWASKRFDAVVRYGHEVVEVRHVPEGYDVVARPVGGGAAVVHRARNLVLGLGMSRTCRPARSWASESGTTATCSTGSSAWAIWRRSASPASSSSAPGRARPR